jgi:lipoprotein signal peptidase
MPVCNATGTTQSGNKSPNSESAGGCPALRDWPSHRRLWLIVAACVSADLLSKSLAFRHLTWNEPLVLIPGFLQLRLSLNPGALFGFGPSLGPVFIAASVLALPFVIYIFAHSGPKQRLLHAALGMILAGALGNLYDRVFIVADVVRAKDNTILFVGSSAPSPPGMICLRPYANSQQTVRFPGPPDCNVRRQGVVRDFIKIETTIAGRELWRWVFNLADSLLVIGVALLLINSLIERRTRHRHQH